MVEAPGTAAATAEGVEMFGGASAVGAAEGGSTGVGRDDEKALFELVDDASAETGRAAAVPLRIGAETFVERWMMSLPCTTSWSFDFLSSRVSVSAAPSALPDSARTRTITAEIQVERTRDGDVDDS